MWKDGGGLTDRHVHTRSTIVRIWGIQCWEFRVLWGTVPPVNHWTPFVWEV